MPTPTTNFGFNRPLINDATDQDLWGGYLNGDLDQIDGLLLGLIPSGAVFPFAGSTAPTGYLLCFGQAVSRTTYAALFAVTSTTYGIGDGSTTFNLPDLRGRAAFGDDDMGGSAANRITNAISGITGTMLGAVGGDQRVQLHTHTASVIDPGHLHQSLGIPNQSTVGGGSKVLSNDGNSNTGTATTGITVTNANFGAGASQNMPPTIILSYIIKT